MPNLDLAPTQEFYRRLHAATRALQRMSIVVGEPGQLIVDCEALMTSPSDIRFWALEYDHERAIDRDEDGYWAHRQSSQESFRLGDLLLGIAFTYGDEREAVARG